MRLFFSHLHDQGDAGDVVDIPHRLAAVVPDVVVDARVCRLVVAPDALLSVVVDPGGGRVAVMGGWRVAVVRACVCACAYCVKKEGEGWSDGGDERRMLKMVKETGVDCESGGDVVCV